MATGVSCGPSIFLHLDRGVDSLYSLKCKTRYECQHLLIPFIKALSAWYERWVSNHFGLEMLCDDTRSNIGWEKPGKFKLSEWSLHVCSWHLLNSTSITLHMVNNVCILIVWLIRSCIIVCPKVYGLCLDAHHALKMFCFTPFTHLKITWIIIFQRRTKTRKFFLNNYF